jgi:hypothetical protein
MRGPLLDRQPEGVSITEKERKLWDIHDKLKCFGSLSDPFKASPLELNVPILVEKGAIADNSFASLDGSTLVISPSDVVVHHVSRVQ